MNIAKRPVEKYDFKALGQAIKDARKERKENRKAVALLEYRMAYEKDETSRAAEVVGPCGAWG